MHRLAGPPNLEHYLWQSYLKPIRRPPFYDKSDTPFRATKRLVNFTL